MVSTPVTTLVWNFLAGNQMQPELCFVIIIWVAAMIPGARDFRLGAMVLFISSALLTIILYVLHRVWFPAAVTFFTSIVLLVMALYSTESEVA